MNEFNLQSKMKSIVQVHSFCTM